MLKEIKKLFYILSIFIVIFFILRFFFSDKNKKNYFKSLNQIDKKIEMNKEKIATLRSDTEDIIEYIDNNLNEKKKNYKFWELLQFN